MIFDILDKQEILRNLEKDNEERATKGKFSKKYNFQQTPPVAIWERWASKKGRTVDA